MQTIEAADWKKPARVLAEHIAGMVQMLSQPVSTFTFIASNGRAFEPAGMPDGMSKGRPKRCYENCLAAAIMGRKYIYAEGYAFAAGVPIPFSHAWLVCPDTGRAFDPTWEVGTAYIGVTFRHEYLAKEFRRKRTSSLIDNWIERWPLLHMTAEQLGKVLHTGGHGVQLNELGKVADDDDD